jgi:hypothetical protein
VIRDRCRKIAKNEKNAKIAKIAGFVQNTAIFLETCLITLVFKKKRQIYSRKLAEIAEKCDNNIDP